MTTVIVIRQHDGLIYHLFLVRAGAWEHLYIRCLLMRRNASRYLVVRKYIKRYRASPGGVHS